MLKMIGMIVDSEVGAALAYLMLVNYVFFPKGCCKLFSDFFHDVYY
jgi:hypothetical protein